MFNAAGAVDCISNKRRVYNIGRRIGRRFRFVFRFFSFTCCYYNCSRRNRLLVASDDGDSREEILFKRG